MNIVYTSSDMYSKPGLISIKSMLENNQQENEINIYYIENKISEKNKAKITELVHQYNRIIKFIPMPDLSQFTKGLLRTNEIVYSYCFLQNILPNTVEKVLLIECDAIVMRPLKELYDLNIDNYYLAAADDVKSKWYKKTLGLDMDSPYINTGIMLLNLDKMRKDNITSGMSELISSKRAKRFYEVQDEINVFFEKKILLIPPKFNCTTALFLYSYKDMKRYRRPSTCFTSKEYNEAVNNPYIVHFTTNQIIQSRPWIENCTHPYKDIYIGIKNQTKLSGEAVWKSKWTKKNKIANAFYRFTPKAFSSFILGIVQAYLYPMYTYYRNSNKH